MQSQYNSPYQAAPATLEYVGVGGRLLALLIDDIILSIPLVLISIAFHSSADMAA
jgi:hypothetical protein